MTNAQPKKKTGLRDILMRLGPALALILMFAVFTIVMPGKFLRVGNLMNVLKQASINCMIGAGMLLCLITAGIDLSVGYNCTLACCLIGVLMNAGITSPFILIPAALLISTFAGFVNGTLLTRLELPHPFVSTLGMKNILWGVSLLITSSTSIGLYNKGIDSTLALGSETLFSFGLPVSFLVVLAVYAIFHVFLNHTSLGRQIYCVGGNAEAARLSGIRSKNVLTAVYTISGLMCGIAGVILAGRVASANPNTGGTYDTDAIAACIIGGASFSGGKGTIWGTLIGALLIAMIRNGLNLMGASNDVQYIVIGAVIILSVTIDVLRGKIEAKARKMVAAE